MVNELDSRVVACVALSDISIVKVPYIFLLSSGFHVNCFVEANTVFEISIMVLLESFSLMETVLKFPL